MLLLLLTISCLGVTATLVGAVGDARMAAKPLFRDPVIVGGVPGHTAINR